MGWKSNSDDHASHAVSRVPHVVVAAATTVQDASPAPVLPHDVIVDQILTRVPAAAAAVRFRAVCRAWHAALTSDHFVQAHHHTFVRDDDAHPEIVFFSPRPDFTTGTAFYTCKLELTAQQNGSSSDNSARELLTVDNVRPNELVRSGARPCLGLTLLFQPKPNTDAYHVCHLSTGEHVSLPPCTPSELAP
ncbi:hypothetical protein PR202_ga06879 [Eleusine coracana subsp. coracana]|uniref:F-box domain-containing protein n=1 Tax=Eleusine coracana subsp. coracana TaxID=191504 RepID=A0AAV5BX03_ELECO|nr:hypothetical protein PR202_ga06879 [Eleusine coracana subsp. coracana]